MANLNNLKIECEHIDSGVKGIIKSELKGTKDFPDQYGVYWSGGHAWKKYIHTYWNDKTKIRIINPNEPQN